MLHTTTIIMADKATRQHALSAQPQAPTISARPPRRRRRGNAIRRSAAMALRRLADRVEPRRVTTRATPA